MVLLLLGKIEPIKMDVFYPTGWIGHTRKIIKNDKKLMYIL